MSKGAISGDRTQQARDNIVSRRQSGLEPRLEDLRDAGLLQDDAGGVEVERPERERS